MYISLYIGGSMLASGFGTKGLSLDADQMVGGRRAPKADTALCVCEYVNIYMCVWVCARTIIVYIYNIHKHIYIQEKPAGSGCPCRGRHSAPPHSCWPTRPKTYTSTPRRSFPAQSPWFVRDLFIISILHMCVHIFWLIQKYLIYYQHPSSLVPGAVP